MKPGIRLKSAVCDTEVMIIRCNEGTIECGGTVMSESKPADSGAVNSDFADGTLLGKRYVDSEGQFELLCVKSGAGSLSVNGEKLVTKDAKALPASD